jgi:hypothetical protein
MERSTDEYIEWAQGLCPEKIADERAPLAEACAEYDAVDERIGDDAESSEFLTRVLWLETAIRLARIGWGIKELEDARWPVGAGGGAAALIRSGF